ncbi:hypothetical protein ASPTUDRAFT_632398 [Aspergillus tubingensis CBS 134.48]|uniref:Uncharacterized protein n=1 Tax=Aspergillus tubingensis (strain CBS 134.48) TaxID=767770 RepID=A0A1L9N494_ASPTC|nr:hypothetical protein ASPTUDRAFT_632398 [Aspergillus tubingensis CBS 134.48]
MNERSGDRHVRSNGCFISLLSFCFIFYFSFLLPYGGLFTHRHGLEQFGNDSNPKCGRYKEQSVVMTHPIHTNRLELLAVLAIVREYAPATMIPSTSHTTLAQYGESNIRCTEHTAMFSGIEKRH